MQVKKSPKADLEKKKMIFLEIGLVVALAVCLVAFEWTSEDVSQSNLGDLNMAEVFEEEIGREVLIPPYPQLTGALGAALFALEFFDAGPHSAA